MLAMLLWLSLLACGARRVDAPDPDALEEAEWEAAFADRANLESLERAIALAQIRLGQRPGDPAALGLLSRAFNARALHQEAPAQALSDLETARSYGIQCLNQNAGFSGMIELLHGRIGRSPVRQLGVSDAACLQSTVWAWVRWVELRGPAGDVDLEPIGYMAEKLAELAPQTWTGPWGQAMVSLLPRAGGRGDVTQAQVLLDRAQALEPDLAEIDLDRILHLSTAQGDWDGVEVDLEAFSTTHPTSSDGRWRLENSAARRAAEELSVGALRAESWD